MPINFRTLPLAAALAVVSCLLVGGGSAQAARGMEIAIQDDAPLLNDLYSSRDFVLQRAQELGVTHIRANVVWSRAVGNVAHRRRAPAQITYNWGPYDALIDGAAARGMRVQLVLTGPAPAWATANRRVGVYKPKAGSFSAFARAAAEHFKGRVARYGIWNEPNWKGWLAPLTSSPQLYRNLYAAGYRAIKRADPRAQVLIGETSPTGRAGKSIAPLKFLRAIACVDDRYRRVGHCRALTADGFAHHPYAFERPPEAPTIGADNVTLGSLSRLTKALDQLARVRALRGPRGRRLGLYLTEYGFFARGSRAFSERVRADYLRRGFSIAQKNRRVRQMLQYQLAKPPRRYDWDTSLLTAGGRATRPYTVLRAWIRRAAVARQPRGGIGLPPAPQ